MTRDGLVKRWLPVLLIIVAGLLAYWNSFDGTFVYDDVESVRDNVHIRKLWPLSEAMSLPLWNSAITVDGRPLLSLTFALNHHFLGPEPWGYHLVNLVIHICAGMLLFGVTRRALCLPRFSDRYGPGSTWLALVVALIWLVHPLQTESVTYIVQRAESLMGMLFLLTLYCAIRAFEVRGPAYAKATADRHGSGVGGQPGEEAVVRSRWSVVPASPRLRRAGWRTAAIAACASGMAVKEIMFSAPLLVLLYDWLFVSGGLRAALANRKGFYAALFSTWLIMFGIMALRWEEATIDFVKISPLRYALTQPQVILYYLRLAVWPAPLVLDYGWQLEDQWPGIVFPGLAVLGMLLLMVRGIRRRAWYGFVAGWFFLILAPTSSIAPMRQALFEHRMYLPLAAVVALIVTGGEAVVRKLVASPRRRVVTGAGLTAAVVILFGYQTHARNSVYHTEIGIWRDNLVHRSNAQVAHLNMGCCLLDEGKHAEAIEHFHMALKIPSDFDYPDAHSNLGSALLAQGLHEQAIWHFQRALELRPDSAVLHYNAGVALEAAGRLQEAVASYRETLRIKPDFLDGYYNLGNALAVLGRTEEAVVSYRRALELKPDHADVHNNLGAVYRALGRRTEAIRHFREAVSLRPDFAKARDNLRETEAMAAKEQQPAGAGRPPE